MPPRLRSVFLLLCTAAAPAVAQHAVGVRDVAWPNPTAQGTPILAARVHYPAATAGANQRVLPRVGGWPTVVVLHGFGLLGNNYAALGEALARAGFVAVLSNTAQTGNLTQEYDGRALHAALLAANRDDPFLAAFDPNAIGLVGHSMGGGNVANVLANNPGYRCGLALAPVPARTGNGPRVDVPVGVVVGLGDALTPYVVNALPFYQSLTGYRQIKFLHLLNTDCNHNNVAGLTAATARDVAVSAQVQRLAVAFLDRFLREHAGSLEDTIGHRASVAPRTVSLAHEFESPQIWTSGPLRLGSRVRLSMAGEPGITGTLAAYGGLRTAVPTPVGALRLDPATAIVGVYSFVGTGRRFDYTMIVPSNAALLGARFSLQAFGNGRTGGPILGNGIELQIVR